MNFFQLAMKDAFTTTGLFAGWPENVVPVHNVGAVVNNDYYVIGKIVAICLVQGGQPPACFCTTVSGYLVYNEIKCKPCINDIPDYSLRQKLQKVCYIPQNCLGRSTAHACTCLLVYALHKVTILFAVN